MKKLLLAVAAGCIAGTMVLPVQAAPANTKPITAGAVNIWTISWKDNLTEQKDLCKDSILAKLQANGIRCQIIMLPCPGKPDMDKPDTDKPDTDKPDTDVPDTDKPDTDVPDTDKPDTDMPDTDVPDTDKPDMDGPDTDKPDTDMPDTDVPDTDMPDTDVPDTDKPDTDVPDTDKPDTDVPDSNLPDKDPSDSQPPENGGNDTEDGVQELTYAEQVVALVNAERKKLGLNEVTLDKDIEQAALVRAMEIENLFSHTRPDGSSFSTVLKENGISFRGTGENIAWGQTSPEAVMKAWMNSDGHRANILNAKFTKMGVGYYQNVSGRNHWVQLFTY